MTAFTPEAARKYFIKRHALSTDPDERNKIEALSGPNFDFSHLQPEELSALADFDMGPRPTVDEASNEAVDEMAQLREEEAEIDAVNEEKLREEKAQEQEAVMQKRRGGQVSPSVNMRKAFGTGMTERGTGIGSEFSRRRV